MRRLYKSNKLDKLFADYKKFKSLLKVMNGDGMGVINHLTVVRIKFILQGSTTVLYYRNVV